MTICLESMRVNPQQWLGKSTMAQQFLHEKMTVYQKSMTFMCIYIYILNNVKASVHTFSHEHLYMPFTIDLFSCYKWQNEFPKTQVYVKLMLL